MRERPQVQQPAHAGGTEDNYCFFDRRGRDFLGKSKRDSPPQDEFLEIGMGANGVTDTLQVHCTGGEQILELFGQFSNYDGRPVHGHGSCGANLRMRVQAG